MYEAHYRLQKRPFSATPDASCCFLTDSVQETLAELLHRVETGQGIGILTGAAGTGKTLLCRRMIAELHHQFTPAFLASANFPTRRALLQTILYEFGQRYSGLDEQELRLELMSGLKNLQRSGRPALLVIDEAHQLNNRLLEEVRTVSNLSEAGQPLVRIVLSGQPALEEHLTAPEMEALNQRIACQVFLDTLTRQESLEYIAFRMKWAGGDSRRAFSSDALQLIAHACNGLPRCINQLCDHSLLLAFVAEQAQVTRQIVEDALSDLKQLPLHWNVPLSSDEANDLSHASELDDSATSDETLELEWAAQSRASRETNVMETTDSNINMDTSELPMHQQHNQAMSLEIGTGAEPMISDISTEQCGDVGPVYYQMDNDAMFDVQIMLPAMEPLTMHQQLLRSEPIVPSINLFEEEKVVDRYAALDAGPRKTRHAESRRPAAALPPQAGEAIQDHLGHYYEALEQRRQQSRPDLIIEELIPLLQEAMADEMTTEPPHIDAANAFTFTPFVSDTTDEIAEEICSDVFNVCAEVQKSLLDLVDTNEITLEEMEQLSRGHDPQQATAFRSEEQNSAPQMYDVIEPEPDMPVMFDRGGRNVMDPAQSRRDDSDESRQVPRPNYKRVFSALRRKLGQVTGRR